MRLIFTTAIILSTFSFATFSQDANAILEKVRTTFETINDLKCDVDMQFDIPGVAIDKISG
jgi:hypothetical protein